LFHQTNRNSAEKQHPQVVGNPQLYKWQTLVSSHLTTTTTATATATKQGTNNNNQQTTNNKQQNK